MVIPEWMTQEQFNAVKKLYQRDPDGAEDFEQFFQRVQPCYGDFVGLQWSGMFVGIEKDGYAHT